MIHPFTTDVCLFDSDTKSNFGGIFLSVVDKNFLCCHAFCFQCFVGFACIMYSYLYLFFLFCWGLFVCLFSYYLASMQFSLNLSSFSTSKFSSDKI